MQGSGNQTNAMSMDLQTRMPEASENTPMRGALRADQIAGAKAFWKRQFEGGIPVLQLPTDRPRSVSRNRTADFEFALSPSVSSGIRQLAAVEQSSVPATAIACFGAFIHRYTSQSDFVIGTLASKAAHHLPLRISVEGDASFRKVLSRIATAVQAAQAHGDFVVEDLLGDLLNGSSQLYQVALSAGPKHLVSGSVANCDLQLEWNDGGDEVEGRFVYSVDLFDQSTIERMVGHFITMVEGIVADPEQKISLLPMLTGREQQQLLRMESDGSRLSTRTLRARVGGSAGRADSGCYRR